MSAKHRPPRWWRDYDAECALWMASQKRRTSDFIDDDDGPRFVSAMERMAMSIMIRLSMGTAVLR